MKYCTHCGAEINDQAVVCPSCGCAVQSTEQTAAPVSTKTNGFAIAGFVLALVSYILSFYGIVGALGLIFSIVGLVQVNKNHQSGKGLAIAGIVLSVIGVILSIILVVLGVSILSAILGGSAAAGL